MKVEKTQLYEVAQTWHLLHVGSSETFLQPCLVRFSFLSFGGKFFDAANCLFRTRFSENIHSKCVLISDNNRINADTNNLKAANSFTPNSRRAVLKWKVALDPNRNQSKCKFDNSTDSESEKLTNLSFQRRLKSFLSQGVDIIGF